MEFIFNIFIISAFCAGLQQASLEGMILGEIKRSIYMKVWRIVAPNRQHWLHQFYQIFIGCIFCMASFWGTLLYWVLQLWVWNFEVDLSIWIMWPITCVCCVFLNGFLFFAMKYVEEKINH